MFPTVGEGAFATTTFQPAPVFTKPDHDAPPRKPTVGMGPMTPGFASPVSARSTAGFPVASPSAASTAPLYSAAHAQSFTSPADSLSRSARAVPSVFASPAESFAASPRPYDPSAYLISPTANSNSHGHHSHSHTDSALTGLSAVTRPATASKATSGFAPRVVAGPASSASAAPRPRSPALPRRPATASSSSSVSASVSAAAVTSSASAAPKQTPALVVRVRTASSAKAAPVAARVTPASATKKAVNTVDKPTEATVTTAELVFGNKAIAAMSSPLRSRTPMSARSPLRARATPAVAPTSNSDRNSSNNGNSAANSASGFRTVMSPSISTANVNNHIAYTAGDSAVSSNENVRSVNSIVTVGSGMTVSSAAKLTAARMAAARLRASVALRSQQQQHQHQQQQQPQQQHLEATALDFAVDTAADVNTRVTTGPLPVVHTATTVTHTFANIANTSSSFTSANSHTLHAYATHTKSPRSAANGADPRAVGANGGAGAAWLSPLHAVQVQKRLTFDAADDETPAAVGAGPMPAATGPVQATVSGVDEDDELAMFYHNESDINSFKGNSYNTMSPAETPRVAPVPVAAACVTAQSSPAFQPAVASSLSAATVLPAPVTTAVAPLPPCAVQQFTTASATQPACATATTTARQPVSPRTSEAVAAAARTLDRSTIATLALARVALAEALTPRKALALSYSQDYSRAAAQDEDGTAAGNTAAIAAVAVSQHEQEMAQFILDFFGPLESETDEVIALALSEDQSVPRSAKVVTASEVAPLATGPATDDDDDDSDANDFDQAQSLSESESPFGLSLLSALPNLPAPTTEPSPTAATAMSAAVTAGSLPAVAITFTASIPVVTGLQLPSAAAVTASASAASGAADTGLRAPSPHVTRTAQAFADLEGAWRRQKGAATAIAAAAAASPAPLGGGSAVKSRARAAVSDISGGGNALMQALPPLSPSAVVADVTNGLSTTASSTVMATSSATTAKTATATVATSDKRAKTKGSIRFAAPTFAAASPAALSAAARAARAEEAAARTQAHASPVAHTRKRLDFGGDDDEDEDADVDVVDENLSRDSECHIASATVSSVDCAGCDLKDIQADDAKAEAYHKLLMSGAVVFPSASVTANHNTNARLLIATVRDCVYGAHSEYAGVFSSPAPPRVASDAHNHSACNYTDIDSTCMQLNSSSQRQSSSAHSQAKKDALRRVNSKRASLQHLQQQVQLQQLLSQNQQ